MEDWSLRKGDAVVTPAGIRIFVGPSGKHHAAEDFRAPSEVKGLTKRERKALTSLGTQGFVERAHSGAAVTGRSASEGTVVPGEMITDPQGRTIRYVGP